MWNFTNITYQNSDDIVNFCISVGDAMYRPWPLLLKQNILDILNLKKKQINVNKTYVE